MGVLKLFLDIVVALNKDPKQAVGSSLDDIIGTYKDFSYVGSRKKLKDLVLREAGKLQARMSKLSSSDLQLATRINPKLAKCIEQIRSTDSADHVASRWFARKNWQSDSGLYPDFVLGSEGHEVFANGALLELKDSEGDTIASFNSTIPTRFKSLQEVEELNGSPLVSNAALVYDFPNSAKTNYLSDQRYCFYAIRTKKKIKDEVRLSLVEGSFFETLPKEKLLEEVWRQLLEATDLSNGEQQRLVSHLSQLKQSEIAKSRQVDKASVKPRFRIMSEVHEDGNLHKYPGIAPRTVNFIIKREAEYDARWLKTELVREGYEDCRVSASEESVTLMAGGVSLQLRYFVILHKRNGEHIVLQYELPR